MGNNAMAADFHEFHKVRAALRFGAKVIWNAVRFPALAILSVMEPIVTGALSALSALSLIVALFFGLVVKPPHFPLWSMIGFSAGCALLIVPYYLLMRLFSYEPR